MPVDSDSLVQDESTRRILDELQVDARISIAELGRRVALSAPAVAERLRRLEESGVIRGYRADVDPRKLGYDISAFVRLSPYEHLVTRFAKLADDLAAHPEILECHHICGDDCWMLKVVVRDTAHLESFLGRLAQIGKPTTSIVMASAFQGRRVAPAPTSAEIASGVK